MKITLRISFVMRAQIAQKLHRLPASPGVYLMKDKAGEIFYIGKAQNLKSRVRSYFSGSDNRAFVALLDHELHDLEVILTHSGKEAMLLENEFIKRHKPRYNVKLVDDSNFLCLRLNPKQAYPRLEVRRRFAKDGARYFGPYHSAASIRQSLRVINRHFQLRTCSDEMMRNRKRPCLQYQIKRCPAPCVYDLSDGSYDDNVRNVTSFLEGRESELLERLEQRMTKYSEALEYESAARIRDQIHAVQRSLERQRVVTADFQDRDVVGFYREGPSVEFHVLQTRDGRMMEGKRYTIEDTELPTDEVVSDFVSRFYSDNEEIPAEILLPTSMEWRNALAELLSQRADKKIQVHVPRRGASKKLVDLACLNARQAFQDKVREAGAAKTAAEKLRRRLRLSKAPERIECFDISHFQGSEIVAACVRLEHGIPNKSMYRAYTIRSTQNQDDFQSMYEVIARRCRRGLEEADFPDLLVIDGGKGQLASARAAMNDHGVADVDVVSLAKSRAQEDTRSPERVFIDGVKDPIVLAQNSAELFALMRARDEAHRFAITLQRKRQRKKSTRSILDKAKGIGPKRKSALLKAFGSVRRLREASTEEIARVIGPKAAHDLVAYLQRTQGGTLPDVEHET